MEFDEQPIHQMITEIKGCDLPLEANMNKMFIKREGYGEFYAATYSCRKSRRGYRIIRIDMVEPISKRSYYKNEAEIRCIIPWIEAGLEIHEIGNESLFKKFYKEVN